MAQLGVRVISLQALWEKGKGTVFGIPAKGTTDIIIGTHALLEEGCFCQPRISGDR